MNTSGWIEYPFSCSLSGASAPDGTLLLEALQAPVPGGGHRRGVFHSSAGGKIELSIGHSADATRFCYLRSTRVTPGFARLLGLSPEETGKWGEIKLPGQLLLGAERHRTVARGVATLLASPALSHFSSTPPETVAVFSVLREGVKYGVPEALLDAFSLAAPEIVVDCHHVAAPEVTGYGRRAVVTLFKDKDLTPDEKRAVRTAFVADSIAGGVVMLSVLQEISRNFPRLEHLEVVAPLVTLHGLARLAAARDLPPIRVHCFETVLNALAPDFYDSAHQPHGEWHASPEAAAHYRSWWGQDSEGRWISDSLCAGVGWSEAFFSPAEQLRMLNRRLQENHDLTLCQILLRSCAPDP
jgi:hypothetical protein